METEGAPPKPVPSRALLESARRGDADAGAELLRRSLPDLHAIALAYGTLRGRDTSTAEREATAEVERSVTAIVARLRRFHTPRAVEPWLWRTALNIAFTRDEAGQGSLPPAHAAAFVLRSLFGIDNESIAAVLGVEPGRIGARLSAARRLLREHWSGSSQPLSCPEYASMIDAMLDDTLLGNDRRLVAKHVTECSSCHAEVEALTHIEENFARAMRDAPLPQPELERLTALAGRLWGVPPPPWPYSARATPSKKRISRTSLVAAGLGAILLVALWIRRC